MNHCSGLSMLIAGLQGYQELLVDSGDVTINLTSADYASWIVKHNGAVAYDGAFRMFPLVSQNGMPSIHDWNQDDTWKKYYGKIAPKDFSIFAEDAFGVQFGLSGDGSIVRFWNETGELDFLEMSISDFFAIIASDPVGTLSIDLYRAAINEFGQLPLSSHFAFRVETALGGELSPKNLQVMNSVDHMIASGKIAQQIYQMNPGESIDILRG